MLFRGDCLYWLKTLPDNSIDGLVTDPPYGYSFMGKDWDTFNEVVSPGGAYEDKKGFIKLPRNKPNGLYEFMLPVWKECLRVLKPGAFGAVMCAPRQDVLSKQICALSDAGFDTGFSSIYWTYASGFPKAHNISKAIDKKNGRTEKDFDGSYGGFQPKPAVEVIIIVQKPMTKPTYVEQALDNGKGISWLDNCRIPYADDGDIGSPEGRFPANLLISDGVLDDGEKHTAGTFPPKRGETEFFGLHKKDDHTPHQLNDSGTFSRYFSLDSWAERNLPFLITPKPSKREKNEGCENLMAKQRDETRIEGNPGGDNPRNRGLKKLSNNHATVKPIKLMSYLITMFSRPGDVILDPFSGSGTTGCAAILLDRHCISYEMSGSYCRIIRARFKYWRAKRKAQKAADKAQKSQELLKI